MGPGRAGRVLHGQRFTLPLRLTTAAQPRLGCRPPPAAMLTNNHHPPPALDDVAERPEVPGRPGRVQRLVQALLEPGPVGVRQGGTDVLGPLGQVRTDRRLATAHAMVPRVQTSLPLRRATEPARRACMPSSPPLGKAIIEQLVLPKQMAASPTMIPPEYGPTPSNTG